MITSFKTDIRNENFDLYFALKAAEMTKREKDLLPQEVLSKIFSTNGNIRTVPIPFLIQIYALTKAMGQSVYLVIKDEEKGLDMMDYSRYFRDFKKRKVTSEFTELLYSRSEFVLGNSEVTNWMEHINRASISPTMNYALKLKNSLKGTKTFDTAFEYMCEMLMRYEGGKRRMVKVMNCQVSEWYVLLYLADGKEKKMRPVYDSIFKNGFNASKAQIIKAFKSLVAKGHISKFVSGKNVDYKISVLGKGIAREILQKFIIP